MPGNRQWYLSSLRRHYGEWPSLWDSREPLIHSNFAYESCWPSWMPNNVSVSSFFSTAGFDIADRITSQCNLKAMSLSSSEITCANSLTLTASDQTYFRYFPSSSVVFYFMKPWEWSSFGFLYQGPAATNKLIMRMIMAISASDMHRRGLIPNSAGQGRYKNPGWYHYEVAVQEFRQYLEGHGTSNDMQKGQATELEFEIIFCTMFLMIVYEWYYGNSVKDLQLHLQGVRCLLKTHSMIFTTKGMTGDIFSTGSIRKKGHSFMAAQFLVWILYVVLPSCHSFYHRDSSRVWTAFTLINSNRYMEIGGHNRGLSGSFYDTLLDSGNPALHPDHLHQCARIWGRCLWGEEYPEIQILDDMENHRALELLHHAFIMKNKIWQLALGKSSRSAGVTREFLYSEIISIREVCFFDRAFTSFCYMIGIYAKC